MKKVGHGNETFLFFNSFRGLDTNLTRQIKSYLTKYWLLELEYLLLITDKTWKDNNSNVQFTHSFACKITFLSWNSRNIINLKLICAMECASVRYNMEQTDMEYDIPMLISGLWRDECCIYIWVPETHTVRWNLSSCALNSSSFAETCSIGAVNRLHWMHLGMYYISSKVHRIEMRLLRLILLHS